MLQKNRMRLLFALLVALLIFNQRPSKQQELNFSDSETSVMRNPES